MLSEADIPGKLKQFLKQEAAVDFLVQALRGDVGIVSNYGYDLYVTRAIERWVDEHYNALPNPDSSWRAEHYIHNIPYVSEVFYAAAWELCRLGVIRPGVRSYNAQPTEDGGAGNGYSVTPFGKLWLNEVNPTLYISTEPGRFSEMLEPYAIIFGEGFKDRANQAIRCYGAHAYLACCVMCGAAAESVLLRLAIDKAKDETAVMQKYQRAGGRKRIEDLVLDKAVGIRKEDFTSGFSLLKYWRDESAHGTASKIAENEAYTSLALLLRCAQYAKDNYTALTS